ncbi:NADH:ubiquinone oxidoreductase [Roseicyclus mahoneyensis]|uniref:Putative flap endonuclease-1-like 5' DNA nuclease n=1 Tax=Roseicyclus mahoneyensis TaxID=164332 RepID=A0A316GKA4_9RHOB|nr:putative flap endonuclease-1-like 5' DNA nuclease [Roseicyclus mahoneyensis]
MNSTPSGLINLAIVWGVASAAGFAGMAALMLLGDWTLLQALFAAAIIFFILGVVLSLMFLSPLPGPVPAGSAGWGGKTTEVSKAAHGAAATPAAAPKEAAPAAEAVTTETATAAAAPEPVAAPSSAPAEVTDAVGTRPAALDGPRAGGADDLKRIKGIGPKLEQLCHRLGFYHFDQIAAWTPAEVAWVDENLEGFKGRVTRDTWVAQARVLAAGGDTEFSRKVDDGDVY